MDIKGDDLILLLGLLVHFLTFVGIFTKLESRLTKLETTLELLLKNLNGVKFIDRRQGRE